jgi:5-methylcytosine-specific restriction enzyme subunit McrC
MTMATTQTTLSIFEHGILRVREGELTPPQYEALAKWQSEQPLPYCHLLHKAVKFSQYVGVIQVGDLTIQVLPKADKNKADGNEGKDKWQAILLKMLKTVGVFDVFAPSSAVLRLQSNDILHLYFELFVAETEYLLHQGMVKHYRRTDANTTALKGSLQLSRHIAENLVHQERFFVRHTTYDTTHLLHQILYKTLQLLRRINTNAALHSRIGRLGLDFPEMPDLNVSAATFDRLVLDRKTAHYRTALDIARLLLLNFHPDVTGGSNHVLAILFDMNVLWERFVEVALKKYLQGYEVKAQTQKRFWESNTQRLNIKPDILIEKEGKKWILDTKWKNIGDSKPSPEDLRQLFAYQTFWKTEKVALVYPDDKDDFWKGKFLEGHGDCWVIKLGIREQINDWQEKIAAQIREFITNNSCQ